ncbi:MAG: asparaginase [Pyramidobacter sp.]
MGRLLVVFTGGTIASGFDGQGKAPLSVASQKLQSSLKELFAERGVETQFSEPLGSPGIDSSEMNPGHWLKLSRCIASELERGLSGVLLLHGTDTMANTAAWMHLCFGRLPIPIVLTGSQLTLDYMTEDVTANLRGAAMACCSDLKGVWIYFNWKLIPGDRAHKAHAMHPDAFTAVNGQPLYFNPDWALGTSKISSRTADKSQIPWEVGQMLELDPDELHARTAHISWYFSQPGTVFHWDNDDRILCLLGYGAGNMQPSVLTALEKYYDGRKKPYIIACSQAEGGVKNPSGYDKVGMARLVRSGFQVWNQTDRSVEFIHSLCCYALAAAPQAPETVLGRYLRRCE